MHTTRQCHADTVEYKEIYEICLEIYAEITSEYQLVETLVCCMRALFGWRQITGTAKQIGIHVHTWLNLSSGQDAGESCSASLALLPTQEGYQRSQEHINQIGPCYTCRAVFSNWRSQQSEHWGSLSGVLPALLITSVSKSERTNLEFTAWMITSSRHVWLFNTIIQFLDTMRKKNTFCYTSDNGNLKCLWFPSFIKGWVEKSRIKIPL